MQLPMTFCIFRGAEYLRWIGSRGLVCFGCMIHLSDTKLISHAKSIEITWLCTTRVVPYHNGHFSGQWDPG